MPWDIGSWELLVLAIIAVIVVGPKELPKMLRTFGQWMSKARSMARQFQRSFDELARETELNELRKGVEELKAGGPIGEIKKELEQSIDPIKREFGDHDPTATRPSPLNGGAGSPGESKPSSSGETISSEGQNPPQPSSDTGETKTKTSA